MGQYKISVNVTNNSQTVTIPGVDATADIGAGDNFGVDGTGILSYQVASAPIYSGGNTTVTLTAPYGGATGNGVTGIFVRDFTADSLPIANRQDLETASLMGRLATAVQQVFDNIVNGVKALTGVNITGGNVSGLSSLSVTANSSGNVSRYIMKTDGNGAINYWCKLATFTPPATASVGMSVTLQLDSTETITQAAAVLDVYVVQLSAGLNPSSFVKVRSVSHDLSLSSDNFMLVSSAAANGTAVDLWMMAPTDYSLFYVTELTRSNIFNYSVAYNDGAAWQAAAPSGAVTLASDWAGSGIVYPTTQNGWPAGCVSYEKSGDGWVSVNLNTSSAVGNGNSVTSVIPVGYRPATGVTLTCPVYGGSSGDYMSVGSGGNLFYSGSPSAGETVHAHFMYRARN